MNPNSWIQFLIFLVSITATSCWQLRISPPSTQLERLATGTDLYLVCQVREDEIEGNKDNVEVSWFKDNTRMTKQKIRKNGYIQASLAFVQPSKGDSGEYTCKATANDETQEEKVSVVFYERAGFVNTENVQHPQEGEDAKIHCETKGDRLDELFWLKNGQYLTDADERGYKFEDDDHTLIIPNFDSEQDDGNYSCNVVQFAQIYTYDISVTAFAKPIITVFDIPEGNYGYEEQNAVFKCQATGKPTPVYKWFKHQEDGKIVEIVAADKYKIDDGLLEINYLTESDAGDYQCEAINDIGNVTRAAKLMIHKKPRIDEIEDVMTKLGETVELVCKINSESDITDAYFMFNKQKYAPVYIPTPSVPYETDAKSEEISTEQNEEVPEPTEAVIEQEGTTDDVFEEDGEENDESESRKKRSVADENIVVEWKEDKTLVLTINNVQMNNMGRYSCHAQNMAGYGHDSAKVLVKHSPKFTNVSAKYIRRKIGDYANIFCEVSAVPVATLKIERNGKKVYGNGVSVIIDETPSKINLTFKNLSESDFGTYQCSAENSEGSAEPAVIDLVEIKHPKNPESIICTEQIYPNFAVCQMIGYSDQRGEWPTHFEVYLAQSSVLPSNDYDWENKATVEEVQFADGSIKIAGLSPTSTYFARFRAVNEAGREDLTGIVQFETTVPWTPEQVNDVVIDCPDVCSINWTAPNDRGAPITGYKLVFTDMSGVVNVDEESQEVTIAPTSSEEEAAENEETVEEADKSEQIIIEVGPDNLHVDLPQLLPLHNYKVEIFAVNDKGESEAAEYFFRTTEKSGLATLFPLPNWFIIFLIIAVIVLFALSIDAFCCKTRQCGILACITSHVRNRRSRIPKDLEQGTINAENSVLLAGKNSNEH
uniref:Uncharacterized protein n=1 Tax=Panagrolaimus sp. JU765 TaxID=591449 RepID=A0AC34QE02_9BILA